jgi:hypothetical protein
MLTGQLALLVAAIFAGGALYINVASSPRVWTWTIATLLLEWKPAYKRGFAMQASLAVVGSLLGLVAWWQDGHAGWLVGALLMIANWSFTLFVIMPTNNKLMAIDPDAAGPDSRAMMERWARLHAVRPALGIAAALAFIWTSLS